MPVKRKRVSRMANPKGYGTYKHRPTGYMKGDRTQPNVDWAWLQADMLVGKDVRSRYMRSVFTDGGAPPATKIPKEYRGINRDRYTPAQIRAAHRRRIKDKSKTGREDLMKIDESRFYAAQLKKGSPRYFKNWFETGVW